MIELTWLTKFPGRQALKTWKQVIPCQFDISELTLTRITIKYGLRSSDKLVFEYLLVAAAPAGFSFGVFFNHRQRHCCSVTHGFTACWIAG